MKAPLDILEEGDLGRRNRCLGNASEQYFKVHENVSYYIEIDTHAQTLEKNIIKILQVLSSF